MVFSRKLLLLSGVDINNNNETEMIAFDTYTNTYVSGFVPSVSQIVCDNTLFARSTYMAATLPEVSFNFSLSPNPVLSSIESRVDIEWTSSCANFQCNWRVGF
jgi:hypothetical protein